MDEPTSAISHREVDALFGMIGDLRRQGWRSSTSRTRWMKSFASPTRLPVLRDGRYIATHDAADLDRDTAYRPDGRPIVDAQPSSGVARAWRGGVGSPRTGATGQGRPRRLPRAARRNPRHCRPAWGRPHETGRALFGLAPAASGEIRIDGRPVRDASPRDAIDHGIGWSPRIARSSVWCRECRSNRISPWPTSDNTAAARGSIAAGRIALPMHKSAPGDPQPATGINAPQPQRRDAAEDRARQGIAEQARDPDSRRADARHRHRRQERDLRHHPQACRRGNGRDHGLVRVARDSCPGPPDPRHAARGRSRPNWIRGTPRRKRSCTMPCPTDRMESWPRKSDWSLRWPR